MSNELYAKVTEKGSWISMLVKVTLRKKKVREHERTVQVNNQKSFITNFELDTSIKAKVTSTDDDYEVVEGREQNLKEDNSHCYYVVVGVKKISELTPQEKEGIASSGVQWITSHHKNTRFLLNAERLDEVYTSFANTYHINTEVIKPLFEEDARKTIERSQKENDVLPDELVTSYMITGDKENAMAVLDAQKNHLEILMNKPNSERVNKNLERKLENNNQWRAAVSRIIAE